MKTTPEYRYADTAFDIRSTDGGGNTLVGHAAVFDVEAVIEGWFREQIAPRAFRKSIKENDIRALFNHDSSVVLGRNRSGTLRLSEDNTGLVYEVDLPNTQAARDLWVLIDRGDITQSSFAFNSVKELRSEPNADAGETLPLFTVKEARLWDVSPVTYPAYESTDVSARAAERIAASYETPVTDVIAAQRDGELSRIWTPQDTTDEPVAEPPEALDATPQPEPRRIRFPVYL